MTSFEDARDLELKTDADYGRFVDAGVPNRGLAIALLKFMPKHMRGDFIYVDRAGAVMSNRLDLVSKVTFISRAPQQSAIPPPNHASTSQTVTAMSYPPTGGAGGPFLRYYSPQGVNAAYGYASLPCDSHYYGFPPNRDNGNMYFNAYDPNGGDAVDAGITQGNSNYDSRTENAFINEPSGPVFTGWHNNSQTWQCGIPPIGYALGIFYGTIPPSLSNGQNLSFLAVGIPTFDPTRMQMPPSQASWHTSAWSFFQTPTSLLCCAGSWQGIPSPCTGCSVARMTTIAQPVGNPRQDGSCFGACSPGYPTARWDEVVMGEIVSQCSNNFGSPPSATCTIETPSNGQWQNGAIYSCDGEYWFEFNQQSALEGVNTSVPNTCSSTAGFENEFTSPPLPMAPSSGCTPDVSNYCAVSLGSEQTGGFCDTGAQNAQGQEIYLYDHAEYYQVFQGGPMLEYLESATEYKTYADPGDGSGCQLSYSWSPNEPAAQYNDSNLP